MAHICVSPPSRDAKGQSLCHTAKGKHLDCAHVRCPNSEAGRPGTSAHVHDKIIRVCVFNVYDVNAWTSINECQVTVLFLEVACVPQ